MEIIRQKEITPIRICTKEFWTNPPTEQISRWEELKGMFGFLGLGIIIGTLIGIFL